MGGAQADRINLELREAELELSRGKTVPEAAKKIGVMDADVRLWKKKYRGLRVDRALRLKDLEKENAALERPGVPPSGSRGLATLCGRLGYASAAARAGPSEDEPLI